MDRQQLTELYQLTRRQTFVSARDVGRALRVAEPTAQRLLDELHAARAVMRVRDGRYCPTVEIEYLLAGERAFLEPMCFEPPPAILNITSLDEVASLPGCAEVVELIRQGPPAVVKELPEEAFVVVTGRDAVQEEWNDRESILGGFHFSSARFLLESQQGSDTRTRLAAIFEKEVRDLIMARAVRTRCGHDTWGQAGVALAEWAAQDFSIILYARAWAGKQRNTLAERLFEAYSSGCWPCGWTDPYPSGRIHVAREPHVTNGKCAWGWPSDGVWPPK